MLYQLIPLQSKSKAILTTYLVYIKDSIGMQGSGVTETEMVSLLKDCVALATKRHGARQPAKEVLHFSSQFQPSYDFEKLFPGNRTLESHCGGSHTLEILYFCWIMWL